MSGKSYQEKKVELEHEVHPNTMQELREHLGEDNELSCRAAYIAGLAADQQRRLKDISEAFVAISFAGKGEGAAEVRADGDFPELIDSNISTLQATNDHLCEYMLKFRLELDTE